MINKLLLLFISIVLLITCTKESSNSEEFVKVVAIESCPIYPFADVELEISNKELCKRYILPPFDSTDIQHIDVYNSWDIDPMHFNISDVLTDSIRSYIMSSGMLDIDMGYTEPISINGVVAIHMGACSHSYVIETSVRTYEFPISGPEDFELPAVLIEFDEMFKRISEKTIKAAS